MADEGGEPFGLEAEAEAAEQAKREADATLAALYKSARPAVELVPGVSLSAIVNACWLPDEAKVSYADIHVDSSLLHMKQPAQC